MNYTKLYNSIISNAKLCNRIKSPEQYFESHHIIPRCLGGDDMLENLVLLTAKEHFVCHHLLTKMFSDNSSLKVAFAGMCYKYSKENKRDYNITSRVYETAKLAHSKVMSSRIVSEETRNKMSASAKVKTFSDEHRKQLGLAIKKRYDDPEYVHPFFGKSHTEETKKILKEKMTAENNPFFGKAHNEETKKIISETHKGKVISELQRQAQSEAMSKLKWYNNGKINKRSQTKPGDDWVEGRLKIKQE